jgi:hypothetical protein
VTLYSPDVLGEHTASIFRVEVLRLKNWLCYEMSRACSMHGGKVRKKRQLGRPSYRWEDNIKIEFRVIG